MAGKFAEAHAVRWPSRTSNSLRPCGNTDGWVRLPHAFALLIRFAERRPPDFSKVPELDCGHAAC